VTVTTGDFRIEDVSGWPTRADEQMGTKEKVWLEAPDKVVHLFKQVRTDRLGTPYADDRSEKLAAEVAGLLGVPAAQVELARRGGAPGVICRRINDPQTVDLAHGNELLGAREPAYDKDLKREHPHYTVEAVHACLAGTAAPAGIEPELTGFDVWAGFLVLDAFIANTDRHHENWGVLIDRDTQEQRLSPSFDHGSSLGFNVPADRLDEMATRPERVERWCRQGRSGHFAGRPNLVELASSALDLATPRARAHWLDRLDGFGRTEWNRIIDRIPDSRMSEGARTFVSKVLDVNRGRLLDVRHRAA
jgi:hypothetical protein